MLSSASARGTRHGAPDRRLEQHEGLDRRGDAGGTRVRRRAIPASRSPSSSSTRSPRSRCRSRRIARTINAVLAKAPKLAEGTRIYDALAAAVAQVRGSALGAARIVLLSDGDDVGSVTSLDSAISQLEAQNIRVFTVGIQSPDFVAGRPRADRRGRPVARTPPRRRPTALTEIYDELGFELGNEYLLRYRSAARPGQNVDVAIAVDGLRARVLLVHEHRRPAPRHPTSRRSATSSSSRGCLIPLVVALVLGLVAFALRARSEPPLEQGARRAARRVRHASRKTRLRPSAARRSTTLLAADGRAAAASAQLAMARGLRRGRRRRPDRPRPDAG